MTQPSPSRVAAAAQFTGAREKLVRRLELEASGGDASSLDATQNTSSFVECERYAIDPSGATFGVCRCGYPKCDHSPAALEAARAPTPTSDHVVVPSLACLPVTSSWVECDKYEVSKRGFGRRRFRRCLFRAHASAPSSIAPFHTCYVYDTHPNLSE